jgi:DNA-binding NtrC family response regulator
MEGQIVSTMLSHPMTQAHDTHLHTDRTLHRRIEDISYLVSSLNDAVADLARTSLPVLNEDFDFYNEVRRFESSLIKGALRLTGGSQVKAAKLLKLKATTLNAKMRALNLHPGEFELQ